MRRVVPSPQSKPEAYQANRHSQQLVGHKLRSEKLEIGRFPEKSQMLVLAIPALFIFPTEEKEDASLHSKTCYQA